MQAFTLPTGQTPGTKDKWTHIVRDCKDAEQERRSCLKVDNTTEIYPAHYPVHTKQKHREASGRKEA